MNEGASEREAALGELTPHSPAAERFYHCWPRRGRRDDISRGLAVLQNMCDRGFLLVPEILRMSEGLRDGTKGAPWTVTQKRISFTHLPPASLPQHSQTFGAFALEYDEAQMRLLGAIPVFYLPLGSSQKGFQGMPAALVARLGEIQQTLDRLVDLDSTTQRAPDFEGITLTRNGQPVQALRMTVGGAKDLLHFLGYEERPWSELAAALRALANLFYPTERLDFDDSLAYYRQREWRIISGMTHHDIPADRPTTEADVEALLKIDSEFFGRILEFRSGPAAIARQCRLMKEVDGRHVLDYAKRLVVPRAARDEAARILRGAGLSRLVVE